MRAQVSPLDCCVWAATWAGSLFISIDMGLLIGIALALLKLFYETAFPAVLLAPPAAAATAVFHGPPQVRAASTHHFTSAMQVCSQQAFCSTADQVLCFRTRCCKSALRVCG